MEEICKFTSILLGTSLNNAYLPHLFNIVSEVLHRAIGQEIKNIQVGKEEVKTPVFANDMTLHIDNSKISPKNLLELIYEFRKDNPLNRRKCLQIMYLVRN